MRLKQIKIESLR